MAPAVSAIEAPAGTSASAHAQGKPRFQGEDYKERCVSPDDGLCGQQGKTRSGVPTIGAGFAIGRKKAQAGPAWLRKAKVAASIPAQGSLNEELPNNTDIFGVCQMLTLVFGGNTESRVVGVCEAWMGKSEP